MISWIKKIISFFKAYIYDSSVNVKNRSFIVFSSTVLVALFAAIPCGLIMGEPLMATISTFVGAVFFTIYVAICIRYSRLERARVTISIVLVFAFLPLMFFTNGGVYGGTPVWLLLGTIYIAMILEGRMKIVMLILNMVSMCVYFSIGYYFPNLITTYDRRGNYFDTIVGLIIVSWIIYSLISFQISLSKHEEADKSLRRLFEQTATALVNAIDAKDRYTHGHSARVAEYSRKIAILAGKSERECDDIYYTALLHDVGKIGIPEAIINKEGKLSDEKYDIIKQHPALGAQILKSISEIPFISIGAHYHHERYDGKGYPDGLKGTDIPEFARIISVADAYDAMTSKRSYRDTIPQQQVREEFVKCTGTQFDPDFARMMIHLIDVDTEYEMKEREEINELSGRNELFIGDARSSVSDGILLTQYMTTITLKVEKNKLTPTRIPKASLLLFDSLDGHYHDSEKNIKDMLFIEYGNIWFDGHYDIMVARKMEAKTFDTDFSEAPFPDEYVIHAVRENDHLFIRIIGTDTTSEVIVALPDSVRFAYIGLTGEYCHIDDIRVVKSKEINTEPIPRIAEEVSYIDGPIGDIPNIQLNGYRTIATDGIPITGNFTITFHTKSLPTARLVWHCPFVNIFSSDDGKVFGKNYKDYMLMRLDGECWEGDPACDVTLSIIKNDDFEGWEAWKNYNKDGFDCTINVTRNENKITVRTENFGILLKHTALILDDPDTIYFALTGDQCAITNIRISR